MSNESTVTTDESNEEAKPAGEDLAEIARQRDDYRNQLLRATADFDNYKKQSKERADRDRQYMIEGVARDVLAAIDNFDRAIEAARAGGATGIVAGLDMVHKQLVGALAKHGVEPIEALGLPFDPNHHEAIMQQSHADKPEGTVVAELVKGYRLKDRVIRPTQVAVSVP